MALDEPAKGGLKGETVLQKYRRISAMCSFGVGVLLLVEHMITHRAFLELSDFPLGGHEWLGVWMIIMAFGLYSRKEGM